MSKLQEAIAKINIEMQKSPDNRYMEIVGQYIIDRCGSDTVAEAILGGKTLNGAMQSIQSAAKKKAVQNVGVLGDGEVFDVIDKYMQVEADTEAREATKQAVDGVGTASQSTTENSKNSKILKLDFDSFM